MPDKQNQTSVHPQGRDYHSDKSVKHSDVGMQSGGRPNPTTKSGDKGGSHKSGHKGR